MAKLESHIYDGTIHIQRVSPMNSQVGEGSSNAARLVCLCVRASILRSGLRCPLNI